MTSKLPINLENLLRQRQVEGERIEYKAGWNPDAILRMLCAFADSAGGSLKISMKSLIVTPLFLSNIILVTLHNFMLLRSR
jgi:cytosine/uracil/thiamine/allantoin permease